ncbi:MULTISPECIES: methyltransferase family protein [Natronolimnohabitans]|uniref:methyltransferase family protein n=1 Tax=Natronolimnohabitans TaxID=2765403 RepID=UPI0006776B90|nr:MULTISPECIES: isoprenylcysteine carboxylmethyltransferase family protein [Natronolimnohabitans]MDQ2050233.1 isoprenylcysteine carboxylmethyltransferase family protein [Natronolimnohabitans sp. A-GB9]
MDEVFVAGLGAQIVLLVGIVGTVVSDSFSFWPPGDRDWRFWTYWTASTIFTGSVLVLAVLNSGTLAIPLWIRYAGGAVLAFSVVFTAVSAYYIRTATLGLEGQLYTGGAYRYTRNPQYVGFIGVAVGLIATAAAELLVPLLTLCIAWLWIHPRPEETWLAEQYGGEYEEYCENVPRFVDSRTFRRLLEDVQDRS